MPELRCTQATVLGLRADVLNLNPFTTDLEDYPPRPRQPDPAPLPADPPRIPVGPSPLQTTGYTSLDAWWWATLCRANFLADDTLLQQTLGARSQFVNYARFAGGPTLLSVNHWCCRMTDRFYIGIQGTANDLQAMQYILTHAVGQLAPPGQPAWNSTFWSAATQVNLNIGPLLTAAGANVPVSIIGHSYGGAVGHVLYTRLRSSLAPALPFDRVVSFGCPRVFTEAAAQQYAAFGPNLQVIRFANDGDIVPQLPPPLNLLQLVLTPSQIASNAPATFNHIGPGLAMQEDGRVLQRQNVNLVASDLLQQFVNYTGFAATPREHLAAHYSDLAQAWYNNSPLSVQNGWLSPNRLYSVNTDLTTAGA